MKLYVTAGYLIALLCVCSSTLADTIPANVLPPERMVGYTVGDQLTQRVMLDSSQKISTSGLPGLVREEQWVTRQAVTPGPNNQWLDIQYQIINSPKNIILAHLPELSLPLESGDSLHVDPWPFTLAPLTPVLPDDAESLSLPLIQPDWTPHNQQGQTLAKRLRYTIGALVIVCVLWLASGFWFRHLETTQRPFAIAAKSIRRLRSTNSTPTINAAFVNLHRAFNTHAGQTIHSRNIHCLFHTAPWLQTHEAAIKQFFSTSDRHFFSNTGSGHYDEVKSLARQLQRSERQHLSVTQRTQPAAHSHEPG